MTNQQHCRRILRFISASVALATVCSQMGCTEGEVAELASGRLDFSAEDVEALERMFLILGGSDSDVGDMDGEGDGGEDLSLGYGDLVVPSAVPESPASAATAGLVPVRNEGIDVDGDGVADFSLAGFGLPARPGGHLDGRARAAAHERAAGSGHGHHDPFSARHSAEGAARGAGYCCAHGAVSYSQLWRGRA